MAMKPKIYLETTIPSYLTARPTRDPIRAEHQRLTREWWDHFRSRFDLYVSDLVIDEVSQGDRAAAMRRLEILKDIPVLESTFAAKILSGDLLRGVPLPPRAAVDSLHIATAIVGGMDFLLSWNCTHIANPSLAAAMTRVSLAAGYGTTVICTPEDILRSRNHGG
jgi:predicted nucleic acid-binding protein